MSFETDRTNGLISWPQRNYKCSFCKKQFKSAQALGGHMNIHRRDRAKLRFSTSWDSDFPKQNPNPNFSSNPNFSPYLSHYSSSSMASFSSQSQHEEKVVFPAVIPQSESDGNTLNMGGPVGGLNLGRGNETRVWKRRESAAWMEHEMGHVSSDAKEDLDLELRLGCP